MERQKFENKLKLVRSYEQCLHFYWSSCTLKPRTCDQVFLDKFLGNFTCSCVQRTRFFPQVFLNKCYLPVCTTGQIFLGGNSTNVKTGELFHDVDFNYLSSFPSRPYTHEQVFLVQKLVWSAFQEDSLLRKNVSRTHKRMKLVKENLVVCMGFNIWA